MGRTSPGASQRTECAPALSGNLSSLHLKPPNPAAEFLEIPEPCEQGSDGKKFSSCPLPEDWHKRFLVPRADPRCHCWWKWCCGEFLTLSHTDLVFCSCPVPGGAQGQSGTAPALHMEGNLSPKTPGPECFTSAIIALLNLRRKRKPVPMYGSKILLGLFVCYWFLFLLSCKSDLSSALLEERFDKPLVFCTSLPFRTTLEHLWWLQARAEHFESCACNLYHQPAGFFPLPFCQVSTVPRFMLLKHIAAFKLCTQLFTHSFINIIQIIMRFFSLNQGMSSHCIFLPFPFLSPLSPQKRGEKASPLMMDISWKNLFYPLRGKATMQLTKITLRTRK